jgi:predicted patatin/cPLA2 family phospholipase
VAVQSIGLVLEGGGMRGVYTAGALEFFADHNLYFPYTIGVSAGACNALSYLSRQKGRNQIVNIDFADDWRYLSWRNLLRKRQLFGMDFIFDEIPNSLVPFDYDTFHATAEEYVVGTTDCRTGEPAYFAKSEADFDVATVARASSSLPLIAPIVEYHGRPLMDGGISDPIPIHRAEHAGFKRNVLILTRHKGYLKKSNQFPWLLRRSYKQYPEFVETILKRHERYNETTAYIEEQERRGQAFVIQPQAPLVVSRIERNQDKLRTVYEQGYADARRMYPALIEWMM